METIYAGLRFHWKIALIYKLSSLNKFHDTDHNAKESFVSQSLSSRYGNKRPSNIWPWDSVTPAT